MKSEGKMFRCQGLPFPRSHITSVSLAAQTLIRMDEFLGPGLSGGSRPGPACARSTDTAVTFQTSLERRGGQEYSIVNYSCAGKHYPNWKPSRKVSLCVIEMETLVQGTEQGSAITQNEIVLIPLGISGPYFFVFSHAHMAVFIKMLVIHKQIANGT